MAQLLRASRLLQGLSLLGAGLGFCLHLLYILYRYFGAGHVPIASPHEATSFFAWCIFLIFFALQYRYRLGLLGAFVIPLGAALMVVAALMPQELRPLSPVLRSHWLGVHTVLAFLANASFALATGVGLMYLVQEHYVKSKHLGELFQRLPSLQRLDELNYRLITVGFPLFSLAIITGALWAQNAWGSYWSWDPREVWSLVTWLIFATVLHARLLRGWRGRRAALLTILGFVTILVAFFGIKLLRKGQHVFL
jgi:cytochrome c-type biogenesis protein CcsB